MRTRLNPSSLLPDGTYSRKQDPRLWPRPMDSASSVPGWEHAHILRSGHDLTRGTTTNENPGELRRPSDPHPLPAPLARQAGGPPPNVGEGRVGGILVTVMALFLGLHVYEFEASKADVVTAMLNLAAGRMSEAPLATWVPSTVSTTRASRCTGYRARPRPSSGSWASSCQDSHWTQVFSRSSGKGPGR